VMVLRCSHGSWPFLFSFPALDSNFNRGKCLTIVGTEGGAAGRAISLIIQRSGGYEFRRKEKRRGCGWRAIEKRPRLGIRGLALRGLAAGGDSPPGMLSCVDPNITL
jgi:hypothetical protein